MRMNIFASFYKKKSSTKNSAHPIHIYSRNKGSAAIILSLMVSGAVLSTIFHSQKNIDWFISRTEQSQEAWENHLTIKYGFTLGGYLVANNLILCKEGGWENTTASCKWNTKDSTVTVGSYNLEEPKVITVDGKDVLTFEGEVKEPTLNNGEPLEYTISFDLVSWKDPNIKNIIGDIPSYTCRNTNTLEMIPDGSCTPPDQKQCKKDNKFISDSVCEYIEEADQDYYIVLISVKPKAEGQQAHYAGIRRPLAHVITSLESNAKCELTCAASDTSQSYPECRGEFQPPSGEELSNLKMKITNNGPGAIYALSLLREQVSQVEWEKDNKGNLVKDNNNNPIPVTMYKVTGDLLERIQPKKEVLLPGEHIDVDDRVTCTEEVKYRITSQTTIITVRAGRGTPRGQFRVNIASGSVNVHAQPFMSLSYTIGSLLTPIGICVERDVDTMGNRKQIPGSCNNQYSVGTSCGSGGVCLYPNIEPRRVFYPKKAEQSTVLQKTVITKTFNFITTIVRYISPH